METLSISAGNVDVDLSKGQTFDLVVSQSVQQFTILNPPNDSTAFTIKISQVASGRSVGINTFKDNGGTSIDVYWPGGVIPIVTQIDGKIDIYSFKTFDGASTLFGIVGGQNFTTS